MVAETHNGALASAQSDTTPGAEARYRERLRQTPPRARLQRALDLSAQVLRRVMADVERSLPGAPRHVVAEAFLRRVYGDEIADQYARRSPR